MAESPQVRSADPRVSASPFVSPDFRQRAASDPVRRLPQRIPLFCKTEHSPPSCPKPCTGRVQCGHTVHLQGHLSGADALGTGHGGLKKAVAGHLEGASARKVCVTCGGRRGVRPRPGTGSGCVSVIRRPCTPTAGIGVPRASRLSPGLTFNRVARGLRAGISFSFREMLKSRFFCFSYFKGEGMWGEEPVSSKTFLITKLVCYKKIIANFFVP